MANNSSKQLEDERNMRVATVEAFKIADQSTQDLRHKLEKEERARKSADSALGSAQRQAKDQRILCRKAKDQLAAAKGHIKFLKKKIKGCSESQGHHGKGQG